MNTPSEIKEEQQQEMVRGMSQAVKDKASATYLAASAESILGTRILPQAYAPYMEQLLVDCGDTADPIERMLIEQIALAHHNIGRLHVQAARAESIQQANAYNSAAARLLAEFRRAILALKAYREPPTTKQVTVVQQQNVAESQQVAYVANQQEASGDQNNQRDIKLSDSRQEVIDYAQDTEPFAKSTPCCSREEEPIEVARFNEGRPRETPSDRIG
jgi:hypothetical protein